VSRAQKRPSLLGTLGLALFALALVLLYWYLPLLPDMTSHYSQQAFQLMGLGLAIPGFLLLLLIILWRLGRFSFIWRRRWLALMAFSLAGWGIATLTDPTYGGEWGQLLLGPPTWIAFLRLAVLFYLGFIFWSPGQTLSITRRALLLLERPFLFLLRQFLLLRQRRQQRRLAEEPVEKPEVKAVKKQEEVPPERPPKPSVPTTPGRLKKAVLEVWKREKAPPPSPAQPIITASGWELPPLELLDMSPEAELRPVDNEKRAHLLEEALASYGVEAKVAQVNAGPTVTQFGVEPGWERRFREVKEKDKNGNVRVRKEEVSRTRVKVERIVSLANDLAMALAVPAVRIEAPVPGKPLVGVEVPNTSFAVVGLRSVMESASFQRLRPKAALALVLGKGAGGEVVVADLAKMPHLLIAGATGSGKTVCLNALICCLMMYNTPEDVRLMMVDPKRVELVAYNRVPHMAFPIIVDREKAVEALRWLNIEMDNRYKKFAEVAARNIEDYNKKTHPPLPYLILFIDELADLMMAAFEEVEHGLCRLAQLARATGIHLVVATQRPSVDVVTGLIKANFPTRLSFAVSQLVDSRTILDMAGAEKLLGRGDMLFLPTEATKPKRLQGCYVSDAEIERLVAFWSRQKGPIAPIAESAGVPAAKEGEDTLLEAARRLAKEHRKLSASFLQRQLQVGYPRAAKLMEALEKEGLAAKENP
jgi:S-DNA-T family DNA segregation ATPase FtsK/SpoIIIE